MEKTGEYYIDKLVELEIKNNLFDIKYKDFPIYRIFSYFIRPAWISSFDKGYSNNNRHKPFPLKMVLKNSFFSFFDICSLFFIHKKKKVAFFPSMRLQQDNDLFLDKFSDPVILQSGLAKTNDIVIFSSSFYIYYRKKRINGSQTYQAEFIYFVSVLFSYIIRPLFLFSKNKKKVDQLLGKVNTIFKEKIDFKKKSYIRFISFIIQYKVYKKIFKHLGCNSVVVVIKGNCYPQILAAHELGIMVCEIQHGVTYGNTVLYAGKYDKCADPDYFLTFGKMWMGPQFGLPLNQLVNIGFAYKDYIKEKNQIEVKDKSVLVVSSPEITGPMVRMILLLSQQFNNYKFYFRPHPHEGLTIEQIESLKKQENIFFSDKSVDSNVEVLHYSKIIGTNSSVLYEAKSYGIDVGRLNFGNLSITRYPGDEFFFYIESIEDFERFLNIESKNSIETYSDFDKEKFLSIVNYK